MTSNGRISSAPVSALFSALASVVASVLLLSGCSQIAPDAKPTKVSFKVCVLAADGGLGDHGFNDELYQGVLQTQAELGVHVAVRQFAHDASESILLTQANRLVRGDCGAIVTNLAGAAAIENVAAKNQRIKFLIASPVPYELGQASGRVGQKLPNVKVISFDSAQAGFLAGVLAASKSRSHRVAAFGARLDDSEIALLAGFHQGVTYFNQIENLSGDSGVAVRGLSAGNVWVRANTGSQKSVAALTAQFIAQGVDVVFPVVGDTNSAGGSEAAGIGAINAVLAAEKNGKSGISILGSVSNWYNYDGAKTGRKVLLGSGLVAVQSQVAKAISSILDASFAGGPSATYVGDINNGGVAMSAEQQLNYPTSYLVAENEIKAQLTSGQLQIASKLGE